jgi:hypothetical protein
LNSSYNCLPNTFNGQNILNCYTVIVNLIDSAFTHQTQPIKQPIACRLIDPSTKEQIVAITQPTQVIELSGYNIARAFDNYDDSVTGFYHTDYGIIFLDQDKWCINTLTHETLHSRSSLSKTKLSSDFDFIIEGITELFVGVTFQRNALNNCYTHWQSIDDCFHDHYEEYVKPWHFLRFKMNYQPIEHLYFDQHIQAPLQQLGSLLEANGCKGCTNLFSRTTKTATLFQEFKDILGRVYPEEFAEFMRTDLRQTIGIAEL